MYLPFLKEQRYWMLLVKIVFSFLSNSSRCATFFVVWNSSIFSGNRKFMSLCLQLIYTISQMKREEKWDCSSTPSKSSSSAEEKPDRSVSKSWLRHSRKHERTASSFDAAIPHFTQSCHKRQDSCPSNSWAQEKHSTNNDSIEHQASFPQVDLTLRQLPICSKLNLL